MFKVSKPQSVKWPVEVNTPRDGGGTTKGTFNVQFRILDDDEFSGIYDRGGKDKDLLADVCVGWDQKLCDENGEPIPFSEEQLEALVKIPYIRTAMVSAYLDCSNGRAAKGN
ncbi:hypothetical protein SAMN05216302_102112 [Nitrosomonas aestuarii]|uniref:Phage tail assembly chaperone n=1 Tax=Nitrosomonas aestuarii TaxID=52441 RepID=A0A1I4DJI7_9PROT|nr:hypothetical protein [Nitrosomonas aestuarii]SFK92021.1 hypothetical protein SAMN05216302_102112 [Nitrosomonas aestuarii]